MKSFLKKLLYYPYIRHRLMPEVQISQRSLFNQYQADLKKGIVHPFENVGHRVFSQFEEDGKILYLLALIGMRNKTFIEIGSDDGLNSNAANLYFHFGYHGLFIDANQKAIERGKRFYAKHPHQYMYPPKFTCSKVSRENINELIAQAGFEGEIDLLSIDIDGNDYWIWDALSQVDPNIVLIETHVEFGEENKVVPYDPNYSYPGKHPLYHGASPEAMKRLGESKGYTLVGANDLGFNFFFVKSSLLDNLLEGKTVEDILWHCSHSEKVDGLEEIANWPFETPHP